MSIAPSIRILEAEPNKRGDLFGRLMGDLFLALGYEHVRLNVHKSGREIDIEGLHRTENRAVIAECKATEEQIGGDDINKFVGSLDAEKRRRKKTQVVGYFVSLAGFRETAVQQEQDIGGRRIILLDGDRVVKELIDGRIIVSRQRAMERAGRCAAGQDTGLLPEPRSELLAHDLGWIWVAYFGRGKERTHFALVHADGEAIAQPLANGVIASDKSVGGSLHKLGYLPPLADQREPRSKMPEAREKYFNYLAAECGEVLMEGLPADQDVGSRRLVLENIFVPLHLVPAQEREQSHPSSRADKEPSTAPTERRSVGQVFASEQKLAILAPPGGGKSTLLKRLAIAYAFPDRREKVDDRLPRLDLLPLFIRCRQLGDAVQWSISKIIQDIGRRAELGDDLSAAFRVLVDEALRGGQALLLVDGLDEISDEGARVRFVNQVRTFLATYPVVGIVVTSREAGFRIVGGALSAHCRHYRLADFDDEDIKRLTLAWHKEVVGDRAEVRSDAEKLAATICSSDRVRQLAQNPLLLTHSRPK
jgi:hypothetical protein